MKKRAFHHDHQSDHRVHSHGKKAKVKRPCTDFPLYPRASGQWAKKIRGKLCYYGVISDSDAALEKYCNERDDLQAGRTPKPQDDYRSTVKQLCDAFYESKENRFKTGDMAAVYLKAIFADRLERVVNHIRAWLWPKPAKKATSRKTTPKKRVAN
ncbi:hypothetical protein [Schlesneria paludicola]|uniref:hypothetical protein n=1 Tax=Schlesneria paludicola TaxID=360056 RepID=UPI0012F938C9|nr:hypothetical protein [Schlesneria paludicola]